MDPEARQDAPSSNQGRLKEPVLQIAGRDDENAAFDADWGSARASRAGDGATAIANFSQSMKMIASSLTSEIFRSRCVFSITLAASATLMLDARCTPAFTTKP